MKTEQVLSGSETEATRKRLRIWREAQPLLEEQHWRELMALTDERALWMTQALFGRQLDYIPTREPSGLVEQQRLFHRVRRR